MATAAPPAAEPLTTPERICISPVTRSPSTRRSAGPGRGHCGARAAAGTNGARGFGGGNGGNAYGGAIYFTDNDLHITSSTFSSNEAIGGLGGNGGAGGAAGTGGVGTADSTTGTGAAGASANAGNGGKGGAGGSAFGGAIFDKTDQFQLDNEHLQH